MEHRCLSGREQRGHCRREEVEIAGEPEALVRCFDKLELPVAALDSRSAHQRGGWIRGLWPPYGCGQPLKR
jgi:hypothetical protein